MMLWDKQPSFTESLGPFQLLSPCQAPGGWPNSRCPSKAVSPIMSLVGLAVPLTFKGRRLGAQLPDASLYRRGAKLRVHTLHFSGSSWGWQLPSNCGSPCWELGGRWDHVSAFPIDFDVGCWPDVQELLRGGNYSRFSYWFHVSTGGGKCCRILLEWNPWPLSMFTHTRTNIHIHRILINLF